MKKSDTTNGSMLLRTLAGILIVILTASSCGNETPTTCSLEGLGVLQGYVTSAGKGVAVQVEARNMEEPFAGSVLHSTKSDSTGWYRMELPAGLYRIEANSRISEPRHSMVGDIIRVLPRVFRFDLKRGQVEIRVLMPEDLETDDFSLRLQGGSGAAGSLHAWIKDGVLTFEDPAVPPGTYTMDISFALTGEYYFLPGTSDPNLAAHLTVGTESAAVYQADFRNAFASISGSVTGSWQSAPYAPMRVMAVAPDSTDLDYVGCSRDGTFVMETPLAQVVRLRSEHNGVNQWIGGNSFETAQVFDLHPGDRITGVSHVESGLQVVLDGPGDQTSHFAQVTIRDEEGHEYYSEAYWNNPFTVCNLRPGRHYLYVNGHCTDQVWAPQWYQGSESLDGATPLDLVEGELQSISVELVRGAQVEGSVLKSDGTAPNRSYCSVFDLDGEPLCLNWGQWRSFDEGIFSFSGLGNGSYYLATLYLDEPLWYPGTWDFSEAEMITIENGTSLTGLEIHRPELPLEGTP